MVCPYIVSGGRGAIEAVNYGYLHLDQFEEADRVSRWRRRVHPELGRRAIARYCGSDYCAILRLVFESYYFSDTDLHSSLP